MNDSSNRADYKEKIRKLLALAESPNEHEARAALLKARQLMAEHKLSELDFQDLNNREVKKIQTGITASKRKNPWIIDLSNVIGENYCCKAYRSHGKREQTQHIGFVGLEDDVDICITVFRYAVDCVFSEIKRIKEKNSCYSNRYVTRLCNSYGMGFAVGVFQAFRKQKEENEMYGLVLVIPQEVTEACKDMIKENFRAKGTEDISSREYERRFIDGKAFRPHERIKTSA